LKILARKVHPWTWIRPIWHGVSADSLKFHPGLPCPTFLRPVGGLQPFSTPLGYPTPYGPDWDLILVTLGVFYVFSRIINQTDFFSPLEKAQSKLFTTAITLPPLHVPPSSHWGIRMVEIIRMLRMIQNLKNRIYIKHQFIKNMNMSI
jgi:hypothetical protein